MNKLKRLIRNYFGFSAREVNGFIVLMLLMPVLLVLPSVYSWLGSGGQPDFAAEAPYLDSLLTTLNYAPEPAPEDKDGNRLDRPRQTEPRKAERFAFNPNTATLGELQRLGLKKYMARNLVNYRKKGGRFRIKRDMAKIYGLPAELYQELEPWIALPDSLPPRQVVTASRREEAPSAYNKTENTALPTEKADLNLADTAALRAVYGIGPKLSQRIVKFRDILGGFSHNRQLAEVWGLDSAVVERVLQRFEVKGEVLRSLNLNTATEDELKAHPYIDSRIARLIVRYREQHGPYPSPEAVKEIKILTDEQFQKMLPYLSVKD